MTPGALLLKINQTFSHGVATAYYRDIVRPKILHNPPLKDTTDKRIEIHVLTSQADWLNLVWTLHSFYAFSPYRLALCIHADATLTSKELGILRRLFPDARVIEFQRATDEVLSSLGKYPRCQALRQKNTLSIKIFDFFYYLESDRLALFDSDLLFYREPAAWLEHVDRPDARINIFNKDISSAYAVPKDVLQAGGKQIAENVNSGFGIVYRDSMRLDLIEELLGIPGLLDGHFWRIEQTLFALCSTEFGVSLLPDEYTVYLEEGLGNRPFRHYVGAIRHLMYAEGMKTLSRKLLS